MMKRTRQKLVTSVGSVATVLLVGCGSGLDTTGPSDPVSLRTEATTEFAADSETGAAIVLRTTLSVENAGSSVVELNFLADCPVVVELHEIDGGSVVFDGGSEPCTRRGERVRIAPGSRHEFAGTVRMERLQMAGVEAGSYSVVAELTTRATAVRARAGRITISNLR